MNFPFLCTCALISLAAFVLILLLVPRERVWPLALSSLAVFGFAMAAVHAGFSQSTAADAATTAEAAYALSVDGGWVLWGPLCLGGLLVLVTAVNLGRQRRP